MLWYTYLYENGMFTNKSNTSFLGKKMLEKRMGKEKRVELIKSLIDA